MSRPAKHPNCRTIVTPRREKKAPPAEPVGDAASCVCKTCVAACRYQPGICAPGDAERIAAHLGLESPAEAVEAGWLIVDYWVGGPKYYRPRRVDETGDGPLARYGLSFLDRFGDLFAERDCLFLTTDGRCSVHAVKPAECAMALPHAHGDVQAHTNKRSVVDLWRQAGSPLGTYADPEADESDDDAAWLPGLFD